MVIAPAPRALQPVDRPSRGAALEWCRANAPDLRIQHADDASGARFTFDGRVFELEVEGKGHGDAIVLRVFETIRARQGHPVQGASQLTRAREIERQIVAARYRGQHAEADALEQELLCLRAGAARPQPRERLEHEGVIPSSAARTRWQW